MSADTGATVGKIRNNVYAMKGGIGSGAYRYGALFVCAVVAVNCVGDVYDTTTHALLAGARGEDGIRFPGSETVILEQYQSHQTGTFYF